VSVSDQQKQTLAVLQGVRSEVLAKAEVGRIQDGRGLQRLLRETLLAKAEATQEPEKKKVQVAIEFVDRTTPMAPLSFGERTSTARTAKRTQRDVLDDLIAQLRQQRVEATANGQLEARRQSREGARAVLRAAFRMAYLRPASAYLAKHLFGDGGASKPRSGLDQHAQSKHEPPLSPMKRRRKRS